MAGKAASLRGGIVSSQQNHIQQERSPYGARPLSQTEEGVRLCSENDPERRIECSMSLLKAVKMIPEQQVVGRDLSTTAVFKHKWTGMTLAWFIWSKCNVKANIFKLAKQKSETPKYSLRNSFFWTAEIVCYASVQTNQSESAYENNPENRSFPFKTTTKLSLATSSQTRCGKWMHFNENWAKGSENQSQDQTVSITKC